MAIRVLSILTILFLPLFMAGQGQTGSNRLLDDARRAYGRGEVTRAIRLAGKANLLRPSDPDVHLLLADIYHDLDSTGLEIEEIQMAIDLRNDLPLLQYRMAGACFRIGEYSRALSHINEYLGKVKQGSLWQKALRLKENCAFAAGAVRHPVAYDPVNLGDSINTGYDEYWPSLTIDNDILVFTRLLPLTEKAGIRQEDFFFTRRDSSGWRKSVSLEELNTRGNEGAQSVSADGKLLFFTLCNHRDGFGSCDIWYSKLEDGKWTRPANAGMPLNTPGWEGQPSLSAAGNLLFFSTDRQGGMGKKDIWCAALKGWKPDGSPLWGEISNLGDSINTAGDEISPFIHSGAGDLYFGSDSWPGFGGFDLYHSRRKTGSQWSKAANLGWPVNSPGNEQGLVIDRTGMTAYFATSRSHRGNMDIFSFNTDETFRPGPVTCVKGRVTNAKTGDPVMAQVDCTGGNYTDTLYSGIRTDENGNFLVTLPFGTDIWFSVKEKGYLFYSERFRFSASSSDASPVERNIRLIPAEPGQTIDLYNIFFATNEYAVLPRSEPELNNLLVFLRENPGLKVEIGGHTDNVGTGEFNRQLSEKRAEAVRQYLLDSGITPQRLIATGYGMNQPVAPNDTEEGRGRNRRTTLRILIP